MVPFWQGILDFITVNVIKIITVALIIFIGWVLMKIAERILRKILIRHKVDHIMINFINSFIFVVFVILIIITVIGALGISTAPFVTVLGTAGLAFALSLQTSLANIASGVVLLLTKPFRQEDYVSIGSVEGSVKKINLLTTELYTFDNKKVVIPNNKVAGSEIINYSILEKRKLELKFSVAYNTPLEKVKKTISSVAEKNPKVLNEPSYAINLLELGQSALVFSLRLWVLTPEYWNLFFELQENIYNALEEAGIEIPYNKLDVNIKETPKEKTL